MQQLVVGILLLLLVLCAYEGCQKIQRYGLGDPPYEEIREMERRGFDFSPYK